MHYRRNLIQVLFSWFCIAMFYVFALNITEIMLKAVIGNFISIANSNKYEYIVLGIAGFMTALMIVIRSFIKGDRDFFKFKNFKPTVIMLKLFFIYINFSFIIDMVRYRMYIKEAFIFFINVFSTKVSIKLSDMFYIGFIYEPMFIYNFISVVILIPIFEEIVVRGIIYNDIKELFTMKVAAIASALLFGILHFNDGLSSNIYIILRSFFTTVFGFFAVYCYEKTKTLCTPIFLHMLVNLFLFYVFSLFKLNFFIIISFISIFACIIVVITDLQKYLRRRKQNEVHANPISDV